MAQAANSFARHPAWRPPPGSRRAGLTAAAFLAAIGAAGAAYAQVVPPSPTALPTPLTLAQAVAIALRQQPQGYIARAQTTQALGQKQQAAARYFPTVTPTYEYQDNSSALYGVPVQTVTVPAVGAGTAGPGTTGATGATTTITNSTNEVSIVRGGGLSVALTQTLFDSGQRELAEAQARRGVDAARYGEANTRQQTVLTVTQDYYNLLEAIDLVKVAQAQVDRFQQTLDLTRAQVAAGTTAAIAIDQSQADLANAQVTYLQDRNSVSTASSMLKNAMGVEADGVVEPAPLAPGDQLPPLPAAGQQPSLDDDLQTAYASRPDLLQQGSVVQSDDDAVRAARIAAGLSVSATAALTYQATNDVGYRGLNTQILLNGTYPLFDAGAARGAVRTARGQRDASLDQLALIRQSIRRPWRRRSPHAPRPYRRPASPRPAVQAARVNYDAAVESRREGIATVLDVTTAQATLTQAQDQYVAAVYNFYSADAALSRAVGRNDVPAGPGATP